MFSTTLKDGSTLYCGDTVQILPMDIFFSVENISMKDGQHWVEGRICLNGNLEDVEIKTKIDRVVKANTNLNINTRRVLNGIASDQYNCHLRQLASSTPYRVQQRKDQLVGGLTKEVAAAFRCKHHKRSFSFGFHNQEVDLDVFGLDFFRKRRQRFNYKEGSIGNLDDLMGEGWDVEVRESKILFVTEMSVWLTREGMLNGQINTAVCHDPLPTGVRMRNHLKRYVTVKAVAPDEIACTFSDE